jgi:hypothetical protein
MNVLIDPAGAVPAEPASRASAGNVSRLRAGLRRCFSFPIFLGGLLVSGVFCSARLGIQDPDTWWHMETGRRILTTHVWPVADPYSYTIAGKPWLPYEWLGDVMMALFYRAGGLQGMTAGVIFLGSLLFVLLYYYAFLRCGNSKAAFLACAAMLPLTVVFFTLRPQLFGYLFFGVTLIILELFRQGRQKLIWALPLVFLLWVNTHGSFTFGILAVGLYLVCGLMSFRVGDLESQRWSPAERLKLASVLAFSILALAITPYGIRVAINPIQMALAQPVNIANIKEWQSMPFGMWRGKLFLSFVLLFVLAQVGLRLRSRLPELSLFLFGVYAACVHVRFLVVFVIIFVPLLAALLARWVPQYEPSQDHPILNAALLIIITAGLVAFFPTSQELDLARSEFYPVSAVQYLREYPVAQPMLNEYGWGGYLIWSSGGQRKVFIDGRADIYESAGILTDYLKIMRLDPNAMALLGKYNIQSCMIQPDSPLATLLSALPGWRRVYVDRMSAIYVHTPPKT